MGQRLQVVSDALAVGMIHVVKSVLRELPHQEPIKLLATTEELDAIQKAIEALNAISKRATE